MKLLCEVSLAVVNFASAHFSWLKSDQANYLFALEDARRLRIFSIRQRPASDGDRRKASAAQVGAQELQSAALSDPRRCTSWSWNHDESLLMLVVDKRQVYFWEVKRNNFVQFKPKFMHQPQSGSTPPLSTASVKLDHRRASKEIELVLWSRLSNKLAVCYSSGQILLAGLQADGGANYATNWEKFVDNSGGILKRPARVVAAMSAELFACTSVIGELLVMSFEGETKLYCQSEAANGARLLELNFSPLVREYSKQLGGYCESSLWIAYQTDDSSSSDGLLLRRIQTTRGDGATGVTSRPSQQAALELNEQAQHFSTKFLVLLEHSACHDDSTEQPDATDSKIVNFHWLSSNKLLVCLSTGVIHLVQISGATDRRPVQMREPVASPTRSRLVSREVFRIELKDEEDERSVDFLDSFKTFELARKPSSQCRFALAAATNFKLFYYELSLEQSELNFELLDDVDLGTSLRRLAADGRELTLERLEWSRDCSMLSAQLTSGHLLVYRTQLSNYLVASFGAQTAFVSGPHEVTLLNYSLDSVASIPANASTKKDGDDELADRALILQVNFAPALLAIGPKHLALALNNRVRFYAIESIREQRQVNQCGDEKEYVTIVTGISLSARFVAVLLDDGRLKLHSLRLMHDNDISDDDGDDDLNDERFFPDPTMQNERISAFTLTEQFLVFCTHQGQIHLFSLESWTIVQVCNHADVFPGLVLKLKANERGNKFVCLVDSGPSYKDEHECNSFLYDLYSNSIVLIGPSEAGGTLWERIFSGQVREVLDSLPPESRTIASRFFSNTLDCTRNSTLGKIEDAVWDTDGRVLLLIETNRIHVLSVLDHTLEREEPIVQLATSLRKASTHTTLYVSQGIVSQQTSLGRVVNSILETHDDELKLTQLELRVQSINEQLAARLEARHEGHGVGAAACLEAQSEVVALKVTYLRSILPIYPISKCHDICDHLMENAALRLAVAASDCQTDAHSTLDSLLWRHLAAWSIHSLQLQSALSIYQKAGLSEQAHKLRALLDDMKLRGLSSSDQVRSRLRQILGL